MKQQRRDLERERVKRKMIVSVYVRTIPHLTHENPKILVLTESEQECARHISKYLKFLWVPRHDTRSSREGTHRPSQENERKQQDFPISSPPPPTSFRHFLLPRHRPDRQIPCSKLSLGPCRTSHVTWTFWEQSRAPQGRLLRRTQCPFHQSVTTAVSSKESVVTSK